MRSSNLISVFGLGYVGLTLSVCLANKGFKVIGVDVDIEKIKSIIRGITPFYEPSLKNKLNEALNNNSFLCTNDYFKAVMKSSVSFICVGTPAKIDGSIDLSYVQSVSHNIGEAFKEKDGYHLIVVRSTVIPDTTESMVKQVIEDISGKTCGIYFGLCVNPEFLREGSAISDTLHPDRIIIGEYDKRSGDILENIYKEFYGEKVPSTLRTSLINAELIKYANNTFLATKISFINEIANICQKIPNTDVKTIAKALGLDTRINPKFLRAGLGWGGSCFPKDMKALIKYAENLNYKPILLKAINDVNDLQPYEAIKLTKEIIGDITGKRIAILGLSFKPNTDDIRNAVSIKIINRLLKEGAEVITYDPAAINNTKKIFGNKIKYTDSALSCITKVDCCILVTEWEEFKKLEPEAFLRNMRQPILIDGRKIYNPEEFSKKLKFRAIGLGYTS